MLKFGKDGKFGILLFGDLHERYDYSSSKKFADMQKMMNAAIEEYKPDICVLLGDILDTYACKNSPGLYKNGILAICGPALRRGIPVYCIMGNHEHDNNCDSEILDIYSQLNNVEMRSEGVPGKADYKELVYSHDGKKPLACLWFLDSNNICEDRELSHYDYVHTDQIEWFESESKKLKELNNGVPMPSYIFQHIPVPEEYRLLRKPKLYEIPVSVRGYNSMCGNRYVAAEGTSDYVGEGPCSPDFNNGQFESWKKCGGVAAAFFGHDHLNDFSGYVDNIFLAQHKTAGFHAYTDGCRSCVRYVEINENNPMTFSQELKHFKEFGLVSESLGPVFKRITDRQSMYLHLAARTFGIAAFTAAAALFVRNKLNHRK